MLDYFADMWAMASQGKLQGIWFWAAVYVLLLCCYSLVLQVRMRNWPSVQGRLLNAEIGRFGGPEWARSEQQFVTDALYEYSVDGQQYSGTRVSPWVIVTSHNLRGLLRWQMAGIQGDEAGNVAVYYHPAKPAKSYLKVASVTGIVVTAIVAILPFMLYYVRFYW